VEKQTAYATCDVDWLYNKKEWSNLFCIGAINTRPSLG
jgi:hypothetical protein